MNDKMLGRKRNKPDRSPVTKCSLCPSWDIDRTASSMMNCQHAFCVICAKKIMKPWLNVLEDCPMCLIRPSIIRDAAEYAKSLEKNPPCNEWRCYECYRMHHAATADQYCLVCKTSMCSQHYDPLMVKIKYEHHRCKSHPHLPLTVYCTICEKRMCNVCCADKCDKCTLFPGANTSHDLKLLSGWVDTISGDMQTVKGMVNMWTKGKEVADKRLERVLHRLDNFCGHQLDMKWFDEQEAWLEERKKQELSKIYELHNENQTMQTKHHDAVASIIKEIKIITAKATQLVSMNNINIIMDGEAILDELKSLQAKVIPELQLNVLEIRDKEKTVLMPAPKVVEDNAQECQENGAAYTMPTQPLPDRSSASSEL